MENYIGEICHFAFNFNPRGYMPCNGAILSISQNSALFSLLGTMYGGDGRQTFAIPDLRGKSPLDKETTDCHYYICIYGIYPTRD
jgi:microcystin-dependent protein